MKKTMLLLALVLLASPANAQWQETFTYSNRTYDCQVYMQATQGCDCQNDFSNQLVQQDYNSRDYESSHQDYQYQLSDHDLEQFAQFFYMMSDQQNSWENPQVNWNSSPWTQSPTTTTQTQVPLRHTEPGGAGEFKATSEGFGQSF